MLTTAWTSPLTRAQVPSRKVPQRSVLANALFAGGLAATLLLPGVARAQAFIPTGNLNDARHSHAAVRMQDGRVLVVGGYGAVFGCCQALASAEIYDPATETFTRTGSMAQARVSPFVVALPSGKVLVAGGGGPMPDVSFRALRSAELYDPDTGTFSPTGDMVSAHLDGSGTLLNDGTVLVAGGSDEFGMLLDSAETYDPATGTFSPTEPMPEARWSHAAALLPDGAVLLAGGCAGACSNSGLRYDPLTRTFSLTSPQIGNRQRPAARTLPDGRVLVAGGYDASGEIYDDVTRTFTYAGSMVEFRQGRDVASLLASGNVLVTGWAARAEIFTVGSGFSPTAAMQGPRDQPTATELLDGTVLIAGGAQFYPFPLQTAEVYDETYEDTVPPSLTVPGNLTVVAPDDTGAFVYFYVAATDNVDPAPLVACEPVSGSLFAIGDTTVDCTATDAAGNSSSGSFMVTVIAPLTLTVTLPKTASVDLRTGVVTMTGTVSCNRPATGFLNGYLTQVIARRATLTGYFGSFIACSGSGEEVWTATVTPSNGRFAAGQASVTSSSYVCESFSCTSRQQDGDVILTGR